MMNPITLLRLSDKIARMRTEDLKKYLDRTCNRCVVKTLGHTPCDSHECQLEQLVMEELNFRDAIKELAK